AMAAKNQQQVWDEVHNSQRVMSEAVAVAGAATEVQAETSYAGVMNNREVDKKINDVVALIEHNYESIIHQLRDKNALAGC
ncbi:MAG: hypothetical protein WAU58_19495, partial [Terriglobales bacterium]